MAKPVTTGPATDIRLKRALQGLLLEIRRWVAGRQRESVRDEPGAVFTIAGRETGSGPACTRGTSPSDSPCHALWSRNPLEFARAPNSGTVCPQKGRIMFKKLLVAVVAAVSITAVPLSATASAELPCRVEAAGECVEWAVEQVAGEDSVAGRIRAGLCVALGLAVELVAPGMGSDVAAACSVY